MCDEALTAIQPMNIEKLQVGVKDIVNFVDTEGKLCGYSLGYEVEDEPFGYAIYDINFKEG